MKNIIFKFYQLEKNEILIVHSLNNGQTFFYDGVSAKLLYHWLLNDLDIVSDLLSQNGIPESDWDEFVDDFSCQSQEDFSAPQTISEEYDTSAKDVYEELYQAGILYSFHLDLTKRCNFRCNHCYHTFDSYECDDLSIGDIEKLFEKLDKLGVFKIVLSGGEPLLRPDIWEILDLCKQHNFLAEIYTNGFLVSDELALKLKQYPVGLLSFSYYGDESATYRVTNNPHAYEHLMKAVDLCNQHHIIYEFKYTILKENVDCVKRAREFCKERSIPLSFELCMIPKIDGSVDNLQSKITKEDYIRVILENRDIMLYPPVENSDTDELECNATKYSLYCDYTGELFPCVSWRKSLGHIRDLEKVWKSVWENNHLKRKKCSEYPSFNKFSFCKYCYQICPGLSYLETKSDADCYNAGCEIAKIVERISTEKMV